MDLDLQIRNLLENLTGRMSASHYDVAWLARLPSNNGQGSLWPELIDWLLDHQWPDGSWGGQIEYHHDRILCTLMSIIVLKERGGDRRLQEAIARGESYIWTHIHCLQNDPIELVGFELLFPTLLAQARMLNLDVPSHAGDYGSVRAAKLRLLPADLLYSRDTSIAFSIEFLGQRGDPQYLWKVLGPEGSVACSPGTTAYILLQGVHSESALSYLNEMRQQPNGIPHFFPLRIFETAWVLEHLAHGGLSLGQNGLVPQAVWQELESAIEPDGVSMDPGFGIKDGDTTSVTARVLALGGRPFAPEILQCFEDPETRVFRTFKFERNASVSTNTHALETLGNMPDYPDRQEVWDRIVTMLLGSRKYQSYWVDKWHASPYYATSHVLVSLIQADEPLLVECTGSLEWIEHMQRPDGSWGYFQQGTVEETAYAMLALLHYYRKSGMIGREGLKQGGAYLARQLEKGLDCPELWIAKCLFAPESVIQAAVLAALHLYRDTFGEALL